MARCWRCGEPTTSFRYKCSACEAVEGLEGIKETLDKGFAEAIAVMDAGLVNIANILEWGFEKLHWEVGEMIEALKGIDETLRTPGMTQANEWRLIAEELGRRRLLQESESFFLRSLEANPLDYRTYIGLGKTYLQLGDEEQARLYWEKSLPHAPKVEAEQSWSWPSGLRRSRPDPHVPKREFDYRSYSYRLIGHLDFCRGNTQQAAATLKKAVDLSPDYYIAHYDYAQYSAVLGDKDNCLSSLGILMIEDPTLLELAEREKNFARLKKEIHILLQPAICLRETQQAVNKAAEAFGFGHKRYFGSNFGLSELNPFNRFWDNLFRLNKAMNENYKLAQQTAYKASQKEILATDSSRRDYIERVSLLAQQTTELAQKIVDLVHTKYH